MGRSSKKMFNENIKNEYIEFEEKRSNQTQRTLIDYFKRISTKERYYEKDISEMNLEEIKDTLQSLNIRRESSIGHILSILRGYVSWARLNTSFNSTNAIEKITPESISTESTIVLQMVKDPAHLKHILDNAIDKTSYPNRFIRDSLVFWLLYSGIPLKEISSLKKDDMENGIVNTDKGNKYEVCAEVLELWDACDEIEYVEKKNGKSVSAKEYADYFLAKTKYLFKPLDMAVSNAEHDSMCSVETLRNIVTRVIRSYAMDNPAIKLTATSVRNSGLFYKLLQIEKGGGIVDSKILANFFNVKNDQNLIINTRKYRIDYEDWKIAFKYV